MAVGEPAVRSSNPGWFFGISRSFPPRGFLAPKNPPSDARDRGGDEAGSSATDRIIDDFGSRHVLMAVSPDFPPQKKRLTVVEGFGS